MVLHPQCLLSGISRSLALSCSIVPTVQTKHLFLGILYLFCETTTGLVSIMAIFQDRPMFSHINGKL